MINRHIVITAGLDGDEYAGIQAASELKDELYDNSNIAITPIVNLPGFEAAMSQNPLDGKYLKHIFPGKSNGSSSEQLMFKLYEQSLKGARLWIDLHGGSLTEELTPFVYSSETGNRSVNQLTAALLNSLANAVIIYTKRKTNYFIESVAQKGIAYLRLEAGQKGEKDGKWVNLHKNWVGRVLTAEAKANTISLKKNNYFYRKTREYKAGGDSVWHPLFQVGEKVRKGQVLGKIYSLERKLKEVLKAREEGFLLWQKVCCFCRSGESLLEVAEADL